MWPALLGQAACARWRSTCRERPSASCARAAHRRMGGKGGTTESPEKRLYPHAGGESSPHGGSQSVRRGAPSTRSGMRWRFDRLAPEAIQTCRLLFEPLCVGACRRDGPSSAGPRACTPTSAAGHPISTSFGRATNVRVPGTRQTGREGWLNWIIREGDQRTAIGAAQATLRIEPNGLSAELSWLIGVAHQRLGYATEAARAIKEWLAVSGVDRFVAYIHPDHAASASVARHLGLTPTADIRGGEIRWATGSA